MPALDKTYLKQLESIASEVQASDILARYLDEEEEEVYLELREAFEPALASLHELVARENPLQLIALEEEMLRPELEGLFLPRLLGYAVLRGELNERAKYVRPQDHFRKILLNICNSANFDILKKRVGQTIQIGFALSSDIWITNLITPIENKRIRQFLQNQKLEKYRFSEDRLLGYERYKQQFKNENYQTAEFPANATELPVLFQSLKNFIIHRVTLADADNSSVLTPLQAFISEKAYWNTREHLQILALYASFFELPDASGKELGKILNQLRKDMPDFASEWFLFNRELLNDGPRPNRESDSRISALLDPKFEDNLTGYYALMGTLHSKGYTHADTQEMARDFYINHEGRSVINECLRLVLLRAFEQVFKNLSPSEYPEFFEQSKHYTAYIGIFANEEFNQAIKASTLSYVRRCVKQFTDKRGRDYQDIKKFVTTTFQELGFLTEKEVVEFFKSRRKRPASE
jgi:hypothetical protein